MIFFSSDRYFEKISRSLEKCGLKTDLLVTEPPKKSGRGQLVTKNPAHQFADSAKIKVLELDGFDRMSIEKINKFFQKSQDKFGFVFAYGKIIPQELIALFSDNIYNLHPSLLPMYRGATPVQTALLDGVKETGYSVIKINDRMDAGDIVFQEKVTIEEEDDYESLREKIIGTFCNDCAAIVKKIRDHSSFKAQQESEATYTRKFEKTDGEIKKSDTAKTANLKVKAFSVWPKAYIITGDTRIIIHKAHLVGEKLVIDEIQKESGKKMSFDSFASGNQTLLTQLPDFVRM